MAKAEKTAVKKKIAVPAGRQGRADAATPVQKEKSAAIAQVEVSARSIGAKEQSELFEQAIASFRSGGFAKAKNLFEKSASGPVREMAHVSRIHAQVCERRLRRAVPAPSGADDYYHYAVALINQRDLEGAERHLQQALRLAPNADHVHYALALARGLRGDSQLASESLRRAIEIDPRNRTQARNDPDFAEISHHPPLAVLLFPDRDRGA